MPFIVTNTSKTVRIKVMIPEGMKDVTWMPGEVKKYANLSASTREVLRDYLPWGLVVTEVLPKKLEVLKEDMPK